MHILFKRTALAAAAPASLFAATTPAQARPHRNDDDAALAIGAGIVGLAIGAAIASDSRRDRYYDGYYDDYPRYRAYPRGSYYYYRDYPRSYRYDNYRYRDGYRYEKRHKRWHRRNGW